MYRRNSILRCFIFVLSVYVAFTVEFGQTSRSLAIRMAAPATVTPATAVWGMIGKVNQARVTEDLRRLTGEVPICTGAGCYTIAHRQTGGEGLGWAMDYLYDNLVDLGYAAEFWNWSASGYADRDLIARKQGVVTPTEEIYLVAHVDGVKGTEALYPAADDNGSGAVDLLEVARIARDYSFERTVVLLFSTGEEQGTLGVSAYLNHLTSGDLSRIKYAIDVDMIGYDANGDPVMELWHGGQVPSIALTQMMSDTIHAYQFNLDPRLIMGCG